MYNTNKNKFVNIQAQNGYTEPKPLQKYVHDL